MLPEDIARQKNVDHFLAIRNQSLELASESYRSRPAEVPLTPQESLALHEAAAKMKAARWRLVPIGAVLLAFGLFQVLR